MNVLNFKIFLKQINKEREEVQQKGAVGWNSYVAYFTAGAGYFGIISVMLLFLAAQGMTIAADYWLSIWSNQEESYKDKQLDIISCLKDKNQEKLDCPTKISETDPKSISLIYDDRTSSYHIYISKI